MTGFLDSLRSASEQKPVVSKNANDGRILISSVAPPFHQKISFSHTRLCMTGSDFFGLGDGLRPLVFSSFYTPHPLLGADNGRKDATSAGSQ